MNTPDGGLGLEKFLETMTGVNRAIVDQLAGQLAPQSGNPLGEAVAALTQAFAGNAEHLQKMQQDYYRLQTELWLKTVGAAAGGAGTGKAAEKGDKRFSAPEWAEYPLFDYIRQSYQLTSKWLLEAVESLQVDEESKKKLRFFTRQYVDAMAPSNFPATNPEVLKLALESKGESLSAGMKNLLSDLEKGRISMTDESVFEVGRNIAVTPGAVVYENELIQLLQYSPTTRTVAERPILMVPPCINKYYIMDLEPENSLVRYAVDQGNTVFMVSWRNVKADLQHLTWDDYLSKGVHEAIAAVQDITRSKTINALGFCVGGTILASALAVMHARNEHPLESMTLMTSLLDFSDVGDIGVYVDPVLVAQREAQFRTGGLVPGKELAGAFSSLRANDLVWSYVVNNYLKGRTPDAFNLLYWNSDATNLPGPMYAYYLRNCYLENRLREPDALTMCGEPIDLTGLDVPAYVFAAREDHIVPWRSAYASTHYLPGPCEFALGASGHIAGSINPASKNKRNFWTGGDVGQDADGWLAGAHAVEGSWWPHWAGWLAQFGGRQVAARTKLGNARHKVIEKAPGRYVMERCD